MVDFKAVDFKAAMPANALNSVVQSLVPLYFCVFHRDTEIRVTRGTLSLFNSLKDKTVIICPPHSHHEDAEVVYWLSAVIHQKFCILTAREMFERFGGVAGPVLQRVGCYSVLRGVRDLNAVRFTEHLLEHGSTKLVIFPEGEISFDSGILNPLQHGAVLMGLEACQHLLQAHKPADIYIIPLNIAYTYTGDLVHHCRNSLDHLERILAQPNGEHLEIRERAMVAASALITREENRWHLRSASSFDERVQTVLTTCIASCAKRLQHEPSQADCIAQIHSLQAVILDLQLSTFQDTVIISPSELRDIERLLKNAVLLHSLRAARFSSDASVETFVEALTVMEELLIGKVTAKGPRRISLKAAEPVNLLDYIQDFRDNRIKTVETITALIAARLRRAFKQSD